MYTHFNTSPGTTPRQHFTARTQARIFVLAVSTPIMGISFSHCKPIPNKTVFEPIHTFPLCVDYHCTYTHFLHQMRQEYKLSPPAHFTLNWLRKVQHHEASLPPPQPPRPPLAHVPAKVLINSQSLSVECWNASQMDSLKFFCQMSERRIGVKELYLAWCGNVRANCYPGCLRMLKRVGSLDRFFKNYLLPPSHPVCPLFW